MQLIKITALITECKYKNIVPGKLAPTSIEITTGGIMHIIYPITPPTTLYIVKTIIFEFLSYLFEVLAPYKIPAPRHRATMMPVAMLTTILLGPDEINNIDKRSIMYAIIKKIKSFFVAIFIFFS